MEKEKSKIRRLVLMSPEFYETLKRRPNVFSKDVLEVEKIFLSIFQSNKLTKPQKLALYNNLFNLRVNRGEKTKKDQEEKGSTPTIPAPSSNVSKETVENDGERGEEEGTDFSKVGRFSPRLSSSFNDAIINDAKWDRVFRPSTSFKGGENSKKPLYLTDVLGEDVYERSVNDENKTNESSVPELDMSEEKRSFIENIRRQSGIPNIDLRDLSFRNMDDFDKDFATVRNINTEDVFTVEKPSAKRRLSLKGAVGGVSASSSSLSRAQKRKVEIPPGEPNTSRELVFSPKRTRSGLERTLNFTPSSKNTGFIKAWNVYEAGRRREASAVKRKQKPKD